MYHLYNSAIWGNYNISIFQMIQIIIILGRILYLD